MNDDDYITITVGNHNSNDPETISISLDDTYGATTTYWDSNETNTIDIGEWNLSGDFGPIDWTAWEGIKPDEVEQMCKHYPGLEKVWRNFKSIYDMCKQDYEGKKKAGEIDDDDIPF